MKLKKPKFWDYKNPNLISNILYPLSKIVDWYNSTKKKGLKVDGIRTICIGNIYLGGTGKTSLSIELKKILDQQKVKTCFIKKNYIDQSDEQQLLKKYGHVIVDKSRLNALKTALNLKFKVAIFDDGLQDNRINYDLMFACFNKKNLIGSGRIIPSGPLRESLDKIKIYKNIFLIGNNEKLTKNFLKKYKNINLFQSSYELKNNKSFNKTKKYIVFSGIGNHQSFIDMLIKNNFNIIKNFEFPDHYQYKEYEIKKILNIAKEIKADVVTTEKDFMRLTSKFLNKIKIAKIRLKINKVHKIKKLLNEIL